MGNQAGSYSFYAKLSLEEFRRRYTNMSDYDSLLQKNVKLITTSFDEQFEQQLRIYADLQSRKPEWFSPVIAWTQDSASRQVHYTMEQISELAELPADVSLRVLLRHFFSLWSAAISMMPFVSFGFVRISQQCLLRGQFYTQNEDGFLKNTLLELFKVDREQLLAEELIKIYSNGVGLEIWKQLNSFFSNLTSAELAIVSIQKLISNNERAITEATESKRESFTNPILHFLEFADLYLVISSDLVDARDSSMAPYKKLEVNVLAASVWNDTLLLIATPKGELKIFNRELKEMRAIDLDGLRVSQIQLMRKQIFLVGRVRQYGHEYQGLKVIECNDDMAVQNVKTAVAKPGQPVITVLHGGRRLVSVSQMNILQVWKVSKDLQLVEEFKGQNDVVSAIVQLTNGRIVSAGTEGHLVLWNEDYQKVSEAYCQSGVSVLLEQTDQLLLVGHIDGAWDLKQGLKTVFSFKAHDLSVSQMELKISRDTRQLITSSWDGDVAWWNV